MSEEQADQVIQRLLEDPSWAVVATVFTTQLAMAGVTSNLAVVQELDNLVAGYARARGLQLTAL